MKQAETEYHSVIDTKSDDNEIHTEPTDDSKVFNSYPSETYLQLKWYFRHAYAGGRNIVGCLQEAFEAGSVAYGCYLVATYNPSYNTTAMYVVILSAAYASFISHVASLIGAIKLEGPSYHKMLKESIGGSVAGAAFLQKHCFTPNFSGVAIGSSLAAFFATVKAGLDIYKENQSDFFRKPIGVLTNLGVNAFFSMLVSTGVIGYTFDIVEGLEQEVSKTIYWTTVSLVLTLNLLSESMLVYLEYNKFPSKMERFLGVTAHLLQAFLYGVEMTAFSLIFWLDAVTDLQDSLILIPPQWGSLLGACVLFGCAVMSNKLNHDKHFRELAAYYIPDYLKNFFNNYLALKQYNDKETDHSHREPADSELKEYVEKSSKLSVFSSCKQTLVNTWNSFHSIEVVGSTSINEEPLLPEEKIETRSWWSSLSCCFWSNKTRTSDTQVKPSHYLPPPINLENPVNLSAQA